ncbi:DEAD/DEAH box helicase [Aquimarina agarivorans]|uniref:DEAD/DEAH box helicase n=1 Tax=Aquimarina agarivorans TaxID=980584 RepID=UPI000681A4E4|nr:DEAD/DEAH box helicase [Aquimarina agarivorans]
MLQIVKQTLKDIQEKKLMSVSDIEKAKFIYEAYDHLILAYGKEKTSFQIMDRDEKINVQLFYLEDGAFFAKVNEKDVAWDVYSLVALYVIDNDFEEEMFSEGMKFTREGMRERVLKEREQKANKAVYRVKLGKSIYGEHTLHNEKGKVFTITLRDFDNRTGYVNNIDGYTNKLGTTKHIMYMFNYLEENPSKVRRLTKEYPFIEIYTNPLDDYKVSWYYPGELSASEKSLLEDYFGKNNYLNDSQLASFFSFVNKSRDFARIKIREEVFEKIETYFDQEALKRKEREVELDYSQIKATPYPYQKEGVAFSVFKKGVIIADEMGLGKTLQAITTAVLKKDIFDFSKVLVICPASVKHQWKKEIEKFTHESACVIEGIPKERKIMYEKEPSFFHIINYETVLRDLGAINKTGYDFVILDEAQKIKNYETKTSNAVKSIQKKHALVITGTPLENKLLDLYSIVLFLDTKLLTPLWEFSYQHCIFDAHSKNRIHGYYNLQSLKKRLKDIIIRREKHEVFEQLPTVIQKNVYVALSDEQANAHAGFSLGIAKILAKKFKTTYDWQKLMHLLTNMRMVCDSSYLIDKQTHFSPKLVELREILIENLKIKQSNKKVIIFSEWVTMLQLIGDMLKKEDVGYTMLTGKVPVKKRGVLIDEFENNKECNVFLSSESGGAGLNLQMADTVINFELPWNPAKKNQRIGRIDRIGQKRKTLHVFNLLSHDSIEMKIAAGISLKQNLFDGVMNSNDLTDEVDFSKKGKSQFIKQLEEVISKDDYSDVYGNEEMINFENLKDELATEENLFSEPESSGVKEEVLLPEKEQDEAAQQKVEINGDAVKTEKDYEQMQEVMTKGMEFLTGIYQMSTGQKTENTGKPKVEINKKTGEVSITFKMN